MNVVRNLIHTGLIASTLLSPCLSADEITDKLKRAFPAQKEISFVQHESIQVPTRNAFNEEKYMLLDFKVAKSSLTKQQLQSSIHSICSTVLKDRDLLISLTREGYDMVSVSFDNRTQYDCL